MPTTVECCLANVTADLRELAGECDLQVREVPCLDHCDRCRTGPFLILNGELYTGSSHRAIVQRALDAEDGLSPIESVGVETGPREGSRQ